MCDNREYCILEVQHVQHGAVARVGRCRVERGKDPKNSSSACSEAWLMLTKYTRDQISGVGAQVDIVTKMPCLVCDHPCAARLRTQAPPSARPPLGRGFVYMFRI